METNEQVSVPATESKEGQASTEPSMGQAPATKTESSDLISISVSELDRRIGEAVFKARENEKKTQEAEKAQGEG